MALAHKPVNSLNWLIAGLLDDPLAHRSQLDQEAPLARLENRTPALAYFQAVLPEVGGGQLVEDGQYVAGEGLLAQLDQLQEGVHAGEGGGAVLLVEHHGDFGSQLALLHAG